MKNLLSDWRLPWLLLLLPVVVFLPALPIDETRYLAVAWEMHLHGNFLVPHLNGATYSQKPPLLFWMINLSWLIAGVHVWVVRLGALIASCAWLMLFAALVRRLDADSTLARKAVWLLLGMLYFALLSSAIMFDVLLSLWVMVALHGALDMDERRWWRGIALLVAGFGLGILTKGPVALLDAGLIVAVGPWWSETARSRPGRWYGTLVLGVVGGAAIALAWAIPAALAGGQKYADAIFLHQTVDRMTKSFAHRRPVWWYCMVLPMMILPWTLSLRAPWRAWRDNLHICKSSRFAIAWFVPAFIAFCLVSGKQPHYLMPLLPGLALYLALVLRSDGAILRGRLFGAVLLIAGVVFALLPYLTLHAHEIGWMQTLVNRDNIDDTTLSVLASVWPLWGVLAAAMGAALLVWGRAFAQPRMLALASVATAAVAMLILAQGIGPYVDVSKAAARIKQVQAEGRPIAHLAWHHGLYEFAGRMTQPLESIDYGHMYDWCVGHPNGDIVTFETKYPIAAKPYLVLPYRFRHISFWHASDLLAAPLPAATDEPDDDDSLED